MLNLLLLDLQQQQSAEISKLKSVEPSGVVSESLQSEMLATTKDTTSSCLRKKSSHNATRALEIQNEEDLIKSGEKMGKAIEQGTKSVPVPGDVISEALRSEMLAMSQEKLNTCLQENTSLRDTIRILEVLNQEGPMK